MSFGTESGINIATLGQNVKKSKHWRSTLACTRSIQMYLYMLRKKNWKYIVYSRLTLLCRRLAADHLKLGLYWRDFDYQPRRIYFIYPTCQAWLCGFSVVAYLDNSHSHIFSSFRRWHIRSISGATKGGYHPFFTFVIVSITVLSLLLENGLGCYICCSDSSCSAWPHFYLPKRVLFALASLRALTMDPSWGRTKTFRQGPAWSEAQRWRGVGADASAIAQKGG